MVYVYHGFDREATNEPALLLYSTTIGLQNIGVFRGPHQSYREFIVFSHEKYVLGWWHGNCESKVEKHAFYYIPDSFLRDVPSVVQDTYHSVRMKEESMLAQPAFLKSWAIMHCTLTSVYWLPSSSFPRDPSGLFKRLFS